MQHENDPKTPEPGGIDREIVDARAGAQVPYWPKADRAPSGGMPQIDDPEPEAAAPDLRLLDSAQLLGILQQLATRLVVAEDQIIVLQRAALVARADAAKLATAVQSTVDSLGLVLAKLNGRTGSGAN